MMRPVVVPLGALAQPSPDRYAMTGVAVRGPTALRIFSGTADVLIGQDVA